MITTSTTSSRIDEYCKTLSLQAIRDHYHVKGHFIPQYWGQTIPHPLVA